MIGCVVSNEVETIEKKVGELLRNLSGGTERKTKKFWIDVLRTEEQTLHPPEQETNR
jgi:hypothetical protein